MSNYFPAAKIGQGNYVFVWSGGWSGTDGTNYYSITTIPSLEQWATSYNMVAVLPSGNQHMSYGITAMQASNIDGKIDDGLPQSGNVLALFPFSGSSNWATPAVWASGGTNTAPYTTATAGSTGTCFDNSASATGTPGVAGTPQHYSTEISQGSNLGCSLSFKF